MIGPEADVVVAGVEKGSANGAVVEAVKKAALAVTDFSWLSKGDTVVIKPVVNSGNDYPTTTSPAGVNAMAELLKDKGAGRVIVTDTSSMTYMYLTRKGVKWGSSRKLMEKCGMARAAEEGGAELYFPEEDGWDAFYEETPESSGHWKGPVTMPGILREADHIVLMPRCARHMMAGSTLGLKAAVGWWRPDTRVRLHRDFAFFQEKIAEANTVPALLEKQRLTLTVADKVLTTFGPDWGYAHEPDTGLVIASESVVAHDMVSLAWLLEGRKATPKSQKRWPTRDPHKSLRAVNDFARYMKGLAGRRYNKTTNPNARRKDVKTIQDCRVLNGAYDVLGGRPKINLTMPDDSVSGEILKKLADHVAVTGNAN